MTQSFRIGERRVGRGHPVFVIAEAGVNHNGDPALARNLIDVAVQARADAVKFQTFRAEELATADAPKAEYQARATGGAESQRDMLAKLELPFDTFRELDAYCRQRGIIFLSTAFDTASADFLDSIGMPAFKIPSGEITNTPLVEHIARKGKPMIVSTGMASLGEVEAALEVIDRAGNPEVAVLQCVSSYPAEAADVNLRAMKTMARAFGVPTGYSDHTMGIEVPLAAAALGACIIEKHFTIDRGLPGPDHSASLEPAALQAMVTGIRIVESALGDGRKRPAAAEAGTAAAARRSLVAARDIAAGETLTEEMIAVRRPGTGLPPSFRLDLVGRVSRVSVRYGELLSFDMFG